MIIGYRRSSPQIDETAFIAPTAVLVGNSISEVRSREFGARFSDEVREEA